MQVPYFTTQAEVLETDESLFKYRNLYLANDGIGVWAMLENRNFVASQSLLELDEATIKRASQRMTSLVQALQADEDEEKNETLARIDLECVKTLYDSMKALPIHWAANPSFWKGMIHKYFFEFVYYRQVGTYKNGRPRKEQLVGLRRDFFLNITTGDMRALLVNCLSRLWWIGHFTYDADSGNPYWGAEVLSGLRFAGSMTVIAGSSVRRRKDNLLGVLAAIKSWKEEGHKLNRTYHLAHGIRHLNRIGAMTLVDQFTRDEIRDMVLEYFRMAGK